MEKTARQVGVAKAFLDHGYSPEGIKLAFVQEGISEENAAQLVKEAQGIMSLIRPLLGTGARGLRTAFGAGMRGGPAAGAWTRGLMEGSPLAQLLGRSLHGGAHGLRHGLAGLSTRPLPTLGRGLLETGKGALFFGGRGVGGALGKGLGGYHMGRMILGD